MLTYNKTVFYNFFSSIFTGFKCEIFLKSPAMYLNRQTSCFYLDKVTHHNILMCTLVNFDLNFIQAGNDWSGPAITAPLQDFMSCNIFFLSHGL